MEEYPKIIIAYISTRNGEMVVKSTIVSNAEEEINFKEEYKKHQINERTLTKEEREDKERLSLPEVQQNISLIESLDLCLAWFARDIDEFHIGDITPTIATSESDFMHSVVKVYPQLNNHRFVYFNRTILRKLVDDGYLFFDKYLYGITIDGILFNQDGGYRQKREDTLLRRERLRIENQRNMMVNLFLVAGSILAGIGAIALVVVEIYKIIYHIQ